MPRFRRHTPRPYLLYAVARFNSIFRKRKSDPEAAIECAKPVQTETEFDALARSFSAFVNALEV